MPPLESTSAVHCFTSCPGNSWLSIQVTVDFLGTLISRPAMTPIDSYEGCMRYNSPHAKSANSH